MSQQNPPSAHNDSPQGDPWHAFGYLVSGVLAYGALGWLVDRWLGTTFCVAIGILLGAGFGIYMTWARFNRTASTPRSKPGSAGTQQDQHDS